MKILLIWPTGMIGEKHYLFPLSLGYLQNSIECSILDCAIDDINSEQLIVKTSGYDLIGISTWGFNIKNVQDTIDLIKEHSDATVVAGGPSAHLVKVDYMILGEGENTFKSFVDRFSRGDFTNLSKIPGVISQNDIVSFPTAFNDNLDELGLIDYEKLHIKEKVAHM